MEKNYGARLRYPHHDFDVVIDYNVAKYMKVGDHLEPFELDISNQNKKDDEKYEWVVKENAPWVSEVQDDAGFLKPDFIETIMHEEKITMKVVSVCWDYDELEIWAIFIDTTVDENDLLEV